MTQTEEEQGLLPAMNGHSSPRASCSSTSTSSGPESPKLGVCRICLEEDSPSNLEAPCSCIGTVQYVHHSCLQRWIEEKGDKVCELCKKPFEGEYEDPPSPLPRAQHVRVWGQEYLVVADPETGTVRAHRLQGLSDDEDEEGEEERMPAATAWVFTAVLLLLCMLLLKHLVAIFARAPTQPPGPGMPGESPHPGMSPGEPGMGPHGAAAAAEADAAFEDLSVSLLVLWLLVRMLVMVVPLWSIATLRQRLFRRSSSRGGSGGGEAPAGEDGAAPAAASGGAQQAQRGQHAQLREVELERRLDRIILRMEAGVAEVEQRAVRAGSGEEAGVAEPLVHSPAAAGRG